MTFISYAQNYEDVMLWRALKHVQNGFYIDVGAAWPDEHSVTKAFYLAGWRGINVEPNPQFNQMLVTQRPEDKNLAVAVGDKVGQVLMKFIKDTGLSTISSQIAEEHIASGWQIQELEVELTTLSDICTGHKPENQEIHFLKVDVEGLEEAVLRGNDWSQYRPWIVVVEATLPMSQEESYASWEPILLAVNYQFAYADGLNRFYVANEHAELREAFKYPPNVFDGFLLSTQQEAEFKAQQAEVKAQQAESIGQHYAATLNAVYASKSWRLTVPLRWVFGQTRRLKHEGLNSRIKAFVKKALRKINHELLLRPSLRQKIIGVSRPLGIHASLKTLIQGAANNDFIDLQTVQQSDFKNVGNIPVGYIIEHRIIDGQQYERIRIGAFSVFFHTAVFSDSRGIGRHARELAYELRKLSLTDSQEEDDLDASIFFFSTIHWCPEHLPENSIVLIHDIIPIIFPDLFGDVAPKFLRKCSTAISQSKMLITISESSKSDIIERFNLSTGDVSVVHNGVTKFEGESRPTIDLPESDYFVFLGTADRHKNLDVVLRATELNPDLRVVLIGDPDAFSSHMRKFKHLKPTSVYLAGRLTDAEAAYVIKRSIALLFPSIYEGFGLPPLEAALLGIPTICSRRPAMTEVLNHSAIFVEPDLPNEWADAMVNIRNNSKLRESLTNSAKAKALELTWERAALRLVELFSGVVRG